MTRPCIFLGRQPLLYDVNGTPVVRVPHATPDKPPVKREETAASRRREGLMHGGDVHGENNKLVVTTLEYPHSMIEETVDDLFSH